MQTRGLPTLPVPDQEAWRQEQPQRAHRRHAYPLPLPRPAQPLQQLRHASGGSPRALLLRLEYAPRVRAAYWGARRASAHARAPRCRHHRPVGDDRGSGPSRAPFPLPTAQQVRGQAGHRVYRARPGLVSRPGLARPGLASPVQPGLRVARQPPCRRRRLPLMPPGTHPQASPRKRQPQTQHMSVCAAALGPHPAAGCPTRLSLGGAGLWRGGHQRPHSRRARRVAHAPRPAQRPTARRGCRRRLPPAQPASAASRPCSPGPACLRAACRGCSTPPSRGPRM